MCIEYLADAGLPEEGLHPDQGEAMTMATEPLETYFALGDELPYFGFVCTALWRCYVGRWEIVDDRL